MSSHLSLFAQVPLNSKFKFGDNPKVFVKTSDEGAHSDGAFYPVNPGVLVFPVPNPIDFVIAQLKDGTRHVIVRVTDGWGLDGDPTLIFNSLEDAINHLGAS